MEQLLGTQGLVLVYRVQVKRNHRYQEDYVRAYGKEEVTGVVNLLIMGNA